MRYTDAMRFAGFEKVETRSRNAWYRDRAREELALMKGALYAEAVEKFGQPTCAPGSLFRPG